MTDASKLAQGTVPWFRMVGALMCEAAARADPAPDLTLSLVERYSDGDALPDGLVQGLRFDLVAGRPSFRVGAFPEERADVEITVSKAGARTLNLLYAGDPRYEETLRRLVESGTLRIAGDVARLGPWLGAVHDAIVDRTA